MKNPNSLAWVPVVLAHVAAAAIAVLLLLSVGQPVFTDDLWWHLALGEAYAKEGPWLAADPILFEAAGPPKPNAWLSDLLFYGVERGFGFTGLRLFHAVMVGLALALAWSIFRRASGAAWVGSVGMSAFALLSAYRFFQLRPHLFTILATLALYRLLLEGGRRPSPGRIALAAVLFLFWANFHSGFLLGLILLTAACAGLVLFRAIGPPATRARVDGRLAALALTVLIGLLATLVNPAGPEPHTSYLDAGITTPELDRVADEWARFDLFRWPSLRLPPTPLVFAMGWLFFLLAPLAAWRGFASWRAPPSAADRPEVDPALVGLALASLVAMGLAVRFVWLGIFPLLLFVAAWRSLPEPSPRVSLAGRWVAGLVALALVPAFLAAGDWSMISRAIPMSVARYAQPYPTGKHASHATWWLADAGLKGHLFGDYHSGGFHGYWLAPNIKTSLNGSMNVPRERMDAARALRKRKGRSEGESFEQLLEDQKIDLFLGTGIPRVRYSNRPLDTTTTHLEGNSDWVPVFRNVRSAVYLRRNNRNRENLERVADFYREEGVPFDPDLGFRPDEVILKAPQWAYRNGLVPADMTSLLRSASDRTPRIRLRATDRIASIYALLGLYEKAIKLDRRTLVYDSTAKRARRRLVWSLLKSGRFEEANEEARALDRESEGAGLDGLLARAAASAKKDDPDIASQGLAQLPLLAPLEVQQVDVGFPSPPARPRR